MRRLAKATPFSTPVGRAPLAIVVCADTIAGRGLGFWDEDCSAAIQNVLLAAHSMGLGGVWIGVHPVGLLVAAVARVIGTPRHIRPVAMVALGHPSKVPGPVDRYNPDFVRVDRWGRNGAGAQDSGAPDSRVGD